jgi:hypothetical protein
VNSDTKRAYFNRAPPSNFAARVNPVYDDKNGWRDFAS